MKYAFLLIILSLISLPSQASFFNQNFIVELESDLGGLDMKTVPHSAGGVAILEIENRSRETANCTAIFKNGPEVPRIRKKRIEPTEKVTLTQAPKRSVIIMKVDLLCSPLKGN